MNFSGILSRKAGRTVNMNANANASQVSNPEVEVAVAEPDAHQAMVEAMGSRLVIGSVPREPKPAARKAKAELKIDDGGELLRGKDSAGHPAHVFGSNAFNNLPCGFLVSYLAVIHQTFAH